MRNGVLSRAFGVVLMLLAVASTDALAQSRSFIEKRGGSRMAGTAFAAFAGESYDQCERRCLGDPQCQAFEHFRGGRVINRQSQCKLFNSVGELRSNRTSDVGIKRATPGTPHKSIAGDKKRSDDRDLGGLANRELTPRTQAGARRAEEAKAAQEAQAKIAADREAARREAAPPPRAPAAAPPPPPADAGRVRSGSPDPVGSGAPVGAPSPRRYSAPRPPSSAPPGDGSGGGGGLCRRCPAACRWRCTAPCRGRAAAGRQCAATAITAAQCRAEDRLATGGTARGRALALTAPADTRVGAARVPRRLHPRPPRSGTSCRSTTARIAIAAT